VPCSLSPEAVHELDFSQSEVKERARSRIPIVTRHVLVPGNRFQVCFLHYMRQIQIGKSNTELAKLSTDLSQIEVPSALASDQHILPLHASLHASSKMS
jgi:hypothetical protein